MSYNMIIRHNVYNTIWRSLLRRFDEPKVYQGTPGYEGENHHAITMQQLSFGLIFLSLFLFFSTSIFYFPR